jgi:hypothetical protein
MSRPSWAPWSLNYQGACNVVMQARGLTAVGRPVFTADQLDQLGQAFHAGLTPTQFVDSLFPADGSIPAVVPAAFRTKRPNG